MADDTSGITALANKFMSVIGPREAEAKVRTESPKIQRALEEAPDIHKDIVQAAQDIEPEVHVKGGTGPTERGAYGSYAEKNEEIELDPALERIYTPQTQKTLSHELLHFLLRNDAMKRGEDIPDTPAQHRWIDAILGPGHPIEGDVQGPAPDLAQLKNIPQKEYNQFVDFMKRHLPNYAPPTTERLSAAEPMTKEQQQASQKTDLLSQDINFPNIVNLFKTWPR